MGPERPVMVTAKHFPSIFDGVFPNRFSLPILISKYYQRTFFQYYKHRVLSLYGLYSWAFHRPAWRRAVYPILGLFTLITLEEAYKL